MVLRIWSLIPEEISYTDSIEKIKTKIGNLTFVPDAFVKHPTSPMLDLWKYLNSISSGK